VNTNKTYKNFNLFSLKALLNNEKKATNALGVFSTLLNNIPSSDKHNKFSINRFVGSRFSLNSPFSLNYVYTFIRERERENQAVTLFELFSGVFSYTTKHIFRLGKNKFIRQGCRMEFFVLPEMNFSRLNCFSYSTV